MRVITSILIVACTIVLSSSASASPDHGGPCGIFAIGNYQVDLANGQQTARIPSKDLLIKNIGAGFAFKGSASCPGSYKILDMQLDITTAKKEVKYHYDYSMVEKMPSMEEYMLARYFNDAQTLHFSHIRVQDANGGITEIPDVSFGIE